MTNFAQRQIKVNKYIKNSQRIPGYICYAGKQQLFVMKKAFQDHLKDYEMQDNRGMKECLLNFIKHIEDIIGRRQEQELQVKKKEKKIQKKWIFFKDKKKEAKNQVADKNSSWYQRFCSKVNQGFSEKGSKDLKKQQWSALLASQQSSQQQQSTITTVSVTKKSKNKNQQKSMKLKRLNIPQKKQ